MLLTLHVCSHCRASDLQGCLLTLQGLCLAHWLATLSADDGHGKQLLDACSPRPADAAGLLWGGSNSGAGMRSSIDSGDGRCSNSRGGCIIGGQPLTLLHRPDGGCIRRLTHKEVAAAGATGRLGACSGKQVAGVPGSSGAQLLSSWSLAWGGHASAWQGGSGCCSGGRAGVGGRAGGRAHQRPRGCGSCGAGRGG